MVVYDTGRALAMASLGGAIILGQLSLPQIYLVSLIEGTLFVFFSIAQVASLPSVVKPEQLTAANAQNVASESITVLVGPPFAGVLYSLSHAIPFVADAISYCVSAISLTFIKTEFQARRLNKRSGLWAEIKEGVLWLWRHRAIRTLAFLSGGKNLVGAGFVLILIAAGRQLGTSAFSLGLILGIGSIGGMASTVLVTRIQKLLGVRGSLAATALLIALLLPLYAVAPNPVVMGAITAGVFAGSTVFSITLTSYRLMRTPDELQGRVSSVFRLISFGGQPVGVGLIGVLLQSAGIFPTLAFAAAVFAALAGVAALSPALRRGGDALLHAER